MYFCKHFRSENISDTTKSLILRVLFENLEQINIMTSFIINNIRSVECMSGGIREPNLHVEMTVICLHMGKKRVQL